MSVGSFYKKKMITQGEHKVNQVLKHVKALAAVEAATRKQAQNNIGTLLIVYLIQFLLFSGCSSTDSTELHLFVLFVVGGYRVSINIFLRLNLLFV